MIFFFIPRASPYYVSLTKIFISLILLILIWTISPDKYLCKANNHHTFFMNNESIAQQIGCKTSSTKVLINKLIREGYILKMEGKNGRRELALSGKYYVPLDGVDMSNQEKRLFVCVRSVKSSKNKLTFLLFR